MWIKIRPLVIIALIGLVVLFVIQNVATVEINFFIWSASMPRAVMVFIIFVLGAVTGWFFRGAQRH